MPYDPLFYGMPPSAALRAELGIPPGAAVHLVRGTSEGWGVTDPRLMGYQGVLVFSLDPDAEGKLPDTWEPGFEPMRFRLARIRFRDDSAYGEIRYSAAEGLYAQPRWPTLWPGRGPLIGAGELERAMRGLRILWNELPKHGPLPQTVENPSHAQQREAKVWQAALKMGRRRARVTQQLVAEDLGIDERTLRSWFPHSAWKGFKQKVLQALSAESDPQYS